MRAPVVLKVGGSLLDWPGFPTTLESYLQGRRAERLLAVIGGGSITDIVRRLDRLHGLGDERSHHLALRSLDLTAQLLAAMVPSLVVIERFESLGPVWEASKVPLLAPRAFLDEDDAQSSDPLPHNWEVTSDSIAARVADRMESPELVLLKSAPLPPGTDRRVASRLGLVDPVFPEAARRLDRVLYLNLRESRADPTLLPP